MDLDQEGPPKRVKSAKDVLFWVSLNFSKHQEYGKNAPKKLKNGLRQWLPSQIEKNYKVCNVDCTALRSACETWHCSHWRSVPLGPNCTGTGSMGHPLPKCWYCSWGSWLRHNFAAGGFWTMKRFSRLLMLFVEMYTKNAKFRHLNPVLGNLGVTHDLGWWLIGNSMVDFLFALIELFRYLLRWQSYDAKCVQLGCFRRGSTSLHSNFTWRGSFPSNHYWHYKTRDTAATQRWRPHPSAFPRFDTIPECDGRIDGRTDGRICRSIYTALAKLCFAERCKIAITQKLQRASTSNGDSDYGPPEHLRGWSRMQK